MTDNCGGYCRPRKVPEVCENTKGDHISMGSKSSRTSSCVARYLNKIPHNIFVDAFHGQGNVYRRMEKVDTEILNDISSKRLNCSKALACRTKNQEQCDRFKAAEKTTQDYRKIVSSNDNKDTLIYMDPPYQNTNYTGYKGDSITPEQLYDTSKKLKNASVAVSYSNDPEFKKLFCHGEFICHKIHNNIFSVHYHELLAVKKR